MELFFHSKNPQTNWLSNLSTHGFTLNGSIWRSVEHYYQAAKFVDPSIIREIQAAGSPLAARKAGQNRSYTPRKDWPQLKVKVMTEAVHAKFTQNRRLRKQLLETGEASLIHVSRTDLFWGRTVEGEGGNRLGLILMSLREELASPDS